MHGRFRWYELYATDTAAAKRFYPAITGWGVERWPNATPDNPYELWTAGGAAFGGLMALTSDMKQRGAPPHWLTYIEAENANATLARANSLGAQTVWGPETVPGAGTLAVIKDPQGAIFGILQAERVAPGFDGKPVLGKPSWHELTTTDYEAAFAFYSALFGWTKVDEQDIGGGMMYLTFSTHTGRQPVGGMFNRMPGMENVPPNWLIYTNHRDARGAVAAVERNGGKVINGPMEVPGGDWIVAFNDPQGVAHALHTTSATAAMPKPSKAKARARARPTAKKKAAPKRKAKPAKAKKAARQPAKKAKKKAGRKKR